MNCAFCDKPIVKQVGLGESSTLVGFHSEEGHNHDDNCKGREYECESGHRFVLSKRASCPCGWKGKKTCFCHKGIKIEEWPNVPFDRTEIDKLRQGIITPRED